MGTKNKMAIENEFRKTAVACLGTLAMNLLVVTLGIATARGITGEVASPEDKSVVPAHKKYEKEKRKAAKSKAVTDAMLAMHLPSDELVDRLNRIQTNTVQNTVPFLMILMMWWLSEVSTAWSTYWMTAFTALRTLYSICYFLKLQPLRTIVFVAAVTVLYSGAARVL